MKIQILILEQKQFSTAAIDQMIANAFQSTVHLKKVIQLFQLKQLFFRESSLIPHKQAPSPSTAKGIAQINRATAADLGWTNWAKEWMNPEKSIGFGTMMLDRLAKDFIDADGPIISQRTGNPAICILHLFYQYPAYRFTILKSLRSGDDEWKDKMQIEKNFFFSGQSI